MRDVIEPMACDGLRTIGVAYRDFVPGKAEINQVGLAVGRVRMCVWGEGAGEVRGQRRDKVWKEIVLGWTRPECGAERCGICCCSGFGWL